MHVFLPVLLLALPLAAQENLFNHPAPANPKDATRVEAEALFSMPPPGGYLPVRVTVVNQRKNDASLSFSSSSTSGSGDEDSRVQSEFAIGAGAGKTTTRDLLVPLTTSNPSGYSSAANNVSFRMSGSFGDNSGSLSCEFAEGAPAVLMSEKLYTKNASALDGEVNSRSSAPRMSGSARFAARFEPDKMPEDWRAYCGYDAMMLTNADWTRVGPGARTAILQWCRLGGRLVVYAADSSTRLASLDIAAEGTEAGNYGFGTVTLKPIDPTLSLDAASTIAFFHDSPPLPALNASINGDYSSRWWLYDEFHEGTFSYALFVVVLIAFGILVGPVNLFVFAKSGMRHKLFITTPIISLGASALLIVLILIKDGVGGHGQRITLMEVRSEPGDNNAYVLQEQISRTGVLLGASFTLAEAAAITPVPIERSGWSRLAPGDGGGGLRYRMNFEDGKLAASGDWFQSRSEQGQLVRAVIPTRWRIELKSQGGAPVVLSSFEFPIDTFHYADRTGGYWVARNLTAGSSVTCQALTEVDYLAAVNGEATRLAGRHATSFRMAAKRTDHWFATSSAAPALGTFGSIRWKGDHALLTGPISR